MSFLTKAEVLAAFLEDVAPAVLDRYGVDDEPAWAEAWNDYTDGLRTDRRISARAYDTWAHPRGLGQRALAGRSR